MEEEANVEAFDIEAQNVEELRNFTETELEKEGEE